MISADLLAILRCPDNRQPLQLADPATLAAINARVSSADGSPGLVNRGGEPVHAQLTEGLLRVDQVLLYPVRAGLPILLVEEAIFL
jgi:uncharacterized protein YbaR (Trm112 family)